MTYEVDLLIPTARFVFSVEGDAVDVLPEHRSPQAFVGVPRAARAAAGGGHDDVPQHRAGARAEDDPRRPWPAAAERPRAARARGAGALTRRRGPGRTHARPSRPRRRLRGRHRARGRPRAREGGLRTGCSSAAFSSCCRSNCSPGRAVSWPPASAWALTPGHCDGHISLRRRDGRRAGRPVRRHHRPGQGRVRRHGAQSGRRPDGVLASWRRIRAWDPASSSPGTCRRSLREAGRAAQRAALCYTQAPVTTPGRLLRAYLRIPV